MTRRTPRVFSEKWFLCIPTLSSTRSIQILYNHGLGGGASYLVAPYPIAATTLFFPGSTPDSIRVVGQVDEQTGVDLQGAACLSFPPTSSVAPAVDDSNTNENTPKLPGYVCVCLFVVSLPAHKRMLVPLTVLIPVTTLCCLSVPVSPL